MPALLIDREIALEGVPTRVGVAVLAKLAYAGADLSPIWTSLLDRVIKDPADAGAQMDLSVIAELTGQASYAKVCQQQALAAHRLYRLARTTKHPKLRLLAICAAADIGDNTPLEFLLQDCDVELYTYYVMPGDPQSKHIVDHDVAFVAVPDSDASRPTLAAITHMLEMWPRPVLNAPNRIPRLERDRFCALVGSVPGLLVPATVRIRRKRLLEIAADAALLAQELDNAAFPVIIRPVGSQAGRGLKKLDDAGAFATYLTSQDADEFFLSPFVDYSGQDGMFRKYRIVFIGGRPYPCHMAIGTDWSLWYLNAAMDVSAEKRREEEEFMVGFEDTFGGRHSAAMEEIARLVGLDYFGLDCAETKDGKLLLFEADIAMIVHDMDPPAIFPYKAPQMRRVFDAFVRMLHGRASGADVIAA
jgi:hypothetical protein